jgi:inner membrane protein
MPKKISTLALSSKIWFLTSIIFGMGWMLYFMLIHEDNFLLTSILATICAAIGSIPVLTTFLIVLPFIKRSNNTSGNKYLLLVLTVFLCCCPYGVIGGNILAFQLSELKIYGTITHISIGIGLLFTAAAISLFILHKNINHYFLSTTNQPNMQQEIEPTQQFAATPTSTENTPNKMVLKAVITGALILVMLIPTLFVMNLITEREQRQKEVTQEISNKWAAPQTLTGPYLHLPYTTKFVDENGKQTIIQKNLFILPENLQVSGNITPEIRPRSIYKVLLYKSDIKSTGNFILNLPKDITPDMVNFSDAKVCFGIRDFKGIQEKITITLQGNSYELAPGLPTKEREIINNNNANTSQEVYDRAVSTNSKEIETIGLSANIAIGIEDVGKSIHFSLPVKINGSEQLHFIPLAGNSTFTLTSPWADPKFDGNNLPSNRTVTANGFSATWNFNKANLPFNTTLKDFDFKKEPYAFGVTMVQPADQYAKTQRSIKYAILFIGLTFALFFIIELMQKNPVHPIQYVLIGLALVIFFTLLLSISEFVLFDYAYLIASVATILLITLYAKGHFKSNKTAAVFATVLTLLYAFIFVLIRLEDTALLVGSIGLFIVLAITMFASRKINWYGNTQPNPAA